MRLFLGVSIGYAAPIVVTIGISGRFWLSLVRSLTVFASLAFKARRGNLSYVIPWIECINCRAVLPEANTDAVGIKSPYSPAPTRT
jgi:hypothetical protein